MIHSVLHNALRSMACGHLRHDEMAAVNAALSRALGLDALEVPVR